LTNEASGEFDDGDNPAKNRAVSSTVADSKLRTGAALSANINVVRMATNVLGMVKHAFQGTVCDDRDPFKAIKTTGEWLLVRGGRLPKIEAVDQNPAVTGAFGSTSADVQSK
jgi:hypothetical protein